MHHTMGLSKTPTQTPKQKAELPSRDLHDVTLGSPAIFQKQDTLKEAQRGILRPVAFRPHLSMGLALYRRRFKLSTGKLAY